MASTSGSSNLKMALVPTGKGNFGNSDGDHTDDEMSKKTHEPVQNTRDLMDEISKLRRENFDLKLRRHLAEEPGSKSPEFIKMAKELENANDLIELLKQDIKEKGDLLREATDAMTRHEEGYQRSVTKSQEGIDKQNEYIKILETKIQQLSTAKVGGVGIFKKIKNFEDMVKAKNEELAKSKEQILLREKLIESLAEKIKTLIRQKEALQQKITQGCDDKLQCCKGSSHELQRTLEMLAPEMKKQKKFIQNTLETLTTMQRRESDLFEILNNYRLASEASNRSAKQYIAEIRKLSNTYKGVVIDSDSESDDDYVFASTRTSLSSMGGSIMNT